MAFWPCGFKSRLWYRNLTEMWGFCFFELFGRAGLDEAKPVTMLTKASAFKSRLWYLSLSEKSEWLIFWYKECYLSWIYGRQLWGRTVD